MLSRYPETDYRVFLSLNIRIFHIINFSFMKIANNSLNR